MSQQTFDSLEIYKKWPPLINESTVNMQKPVFENNGQNKVRISIHQYYSVQKCLKKKKKL